MTSSEPAMGGIESRQGSDFATEEATKLIVALKALVPCRRLPVGYQKRYDLRVIEIVARIKRELEEYLRLLEAEYRTESAKTGKIGRASCRERVL